MYTVLYTVEILHALKMSKKKKQKGADWKTSPDKNGFGTDFKRGRPYAAETGKYVGADSDNL